MFVVDFCGAFQIELLPLVASRNPVEVSVEAVGLLWLIRWVNGNSVDVDPPDVGFDLTSLGVGPFDESRTIARKLPCAYGDRQGCKIEVGPFEEEEN